RDDRRRPRLSAAEANALEHPGNALGDVGDRDDVLRIRRVHRDRLLRFVPGRLTSTLGGTLLPPRPAAPAGGAVDTAIMAATSGTTRTAIRRMSGTFWELGNLRP